MFRVKLNLVKSFIDYQGVGLQAEEAVQAEAARRLASIGSDRTSWPAVARDEIVRLEKKQQVLRSPSCLTIHTRKHPSV